jgi:hypothetical protein
MVDENRIVLIALLLLIALVIAAVRGKMMWGDVGFVLLLLVVLVYAVSGTIFCTIPECQGQYICKTEVHRTFRINDCIDFPNYEKRRYNYYHTEQLEKEAENSRREATFRAECRRNMGLCTMEETCGDEFKILPQGTTEDPNEKLERRKCQAEYDAVAGSKFRPYLR